MGSLCAGIDLQVHEQLVAQTGLGQNALDGHLDEEGRFLRQIVGRRSEALAAGVSGVTRVDLVGHFVARELHLLRVDDDDVVTAVDVGCVAGLVLASEDLRDLRCKTSQYLVRSVDDDPFLGHRRCIGRDSLVA